MISSLFSMLVDLLNHPRITAQDLAAKLEISERTVYRYVDILSFAQIPIECSRGRGGGISIGQDFKLHAQYLTEQELQLTISALETLPFSQSTGRIKDKLQNLDKGKKSDNLYKNEHFIVDKSTFGNNDKIRGKMEALVNAKESRTALKINYHDRDGNTSERIIEPCTIVYGGGIWYVYAWCRMRNEMRMFKISRITHILPTTLPFEPRKIEQNWDIKAHTNNADEEINIVIKVNQLARYDVEEWLGVESVLPSGDCWIAQGFVSSGDTTINKLLSFHENVEVLSPNSMKNKLVSCCQHILNTYNKIN